MNKEEKAYIRSMNWKEKLKWKLLIILIALIGILIVWCAGKAGERKAVTEKEILREYAQNENEWASAKTALPKAGGRSARGSYGRTFYSCGFNDK